jgi:hypothetical protein
MGVVGVDVGVQRPGVDDQRDGWVSEAKVTAMVGAPRRRSPRWPGFEATVTAMARLPRRRSPDGPPSEATVTAFARPPRRRSPRWPALRADDLLDPLRDVASPAPGGGPGAEPPSAADPEMLLERGTRDLRDRHPAKPGLMAQAGIQVVGELDGGALHRYASILTRGPRSQAGCTRRDGVSSASASKSSSCVQTGRSCTSAVAATIASIAPALRPFVLAVASSSARRSATASS